MVIVLKALKGGGYQLMSVFCILFVVVLFSLVFVVVLGITSFQFLLYKYMCVCIYMYAKGEGGSRGNIES